MRAYYRGTAAAPNLRPRPTKYRGGSGLDPKVVYWRERADAMQHHEGNLRLRSSIPINKPSLPVEMQDFVEWQRACRHEAAHALASIATTGQAELIRVFRNSAGHIEGEFHAQPPLQHQPTRTTAQTADCIAGLAVNISDKSFIESRLTEKLAGFACSLGDGDPNAFDGSQYDREIALAMARAATKSEVEAQSRLNRCLLVASGILDRNRQGLAALGDRLASAGVLHGPEIRRVLAENGFPAPDRDRPDPSNLSAWPCTRGALEWLSGSSNVVGWSLIMRNMGPSVRA